MGFRRSLNGATVTGTLTAGNVPILTATGIQDSGVALVSTLAANSVWGNNSASSGPPSALTVLNMGTGTVGAPIYSFSTDATTGMYMSASGNLDFAVGGKRAITLGTVSASGNYVQFSANSTPTFRAQGGANTPLQIAGNGTGGVDLMSGGAATYIWRSAPGSGTNVNYWKSLASATTVAIELQAVGTDTDISMLLTPKGAGTVKSASPGYFMSGTAIPAGGTAGSGLLLSSTTNFGVFFGSGAPTLAAAKGSLYLRSNGSTTNDRVYVNTDGSTAWVAITTAS